MKTKRSETDLSTWTVRELKKRAQGLFSATQESDAVPHDLFELEAVEAELNRRGYRCLESRTLSIVKG
jgi:hypothetical protein